jgi:hypothetical protein
MIKEFEFYHGAAIARLVHSNVPFSIRLYSNKSNASYVVNDKVGLYLKHCSKRMTPWRFSFSLDHQAEINDMNKEIGRVIIGLICHHDGVVGLTYEEFRSVLDSSCKGAEWICVSRKAREKYSINGSDGKLRYKIGEADLAQRVLEPLI